MSKIIRVPEARPTTSPRAIAPSVARGLRAIVSLASTELDNGEEGSGWCECMTPRERTDAQTAIDYLNALCGESRRDPLEALARLFEVAMSDTDQGERVRRFLLAWHNASVWGGFDPSDLWSLDSALVADVELVIATLLRVRGRYPGDWLPTHTRRLLDHVARPKRARKRTP